MFKYDPLVYMALLALILALGVAAWVIKETPETGDPEARMVRMAAATLTGFLMLFVFVAVLYYDQAGAGAGKDIFDKSFAALTGFVGIMAGRFWDSKTVTSRTTGREALK